MKHSTIQRAMLALAALVGSLPLMAYQIAFDNSQGQTIYYDITNEYWDEKYDGEGNLQSRVHCRDLSVVRMDEDFRYSGNIVIPEPFVIGEFTYKVTSLGEYSFADCSALSSVTLPSTLTRIQYRAFRYSSLPSITIPRSLRQIDGEVFDECESLQDVYIEDLASWNKVEINSSPLKYASRMYINGELVTDLVIPDGFTEIGGSVFNYAKSLRSVTIPASVTRIGYNAFASSHVKHVYGCEGVSVIFNGAFNSCPYLETITWGNNVKTINDYAFYECHNLRSIGPCTNVKTIGDVSFMSCSSLKSISLGAGIQDISTIAFHGCDALERVNITDLDAWILFLSRTQFNPFGCNAEVLLNGEKIPEVVIPNGTNNIFAEMFRNFKSLERVTIPSSVKNIGEKAFAYCANLHSIVGATGVETIENEAFHNCTGIENIAFGENLRTIGVNAFLGCANLKSISLGTGLRTICYGAFRECTNLRTVSGGEGLVTIDESAFQGCTGIKNVSFGASLQTIGRYAFSGCTALEDIAFGAKLRTIGDWAFYKCTSLRSITGLGIATIGEYAFCDCTGLEQITFGDALQTINGMAFYNCPLIKNLVIPANVTRIGGGVFENVSDIIIMQPTTPPSIEDNTFAEKYNTFIVPPSALEAYREAWGRHSVYIISDKYAFAHNVEVAALDEDSDVRCKVIAGAEDSEEALRSTITLKVKGSINSYDIMIMRNKMKNLRHLDLTDANVVYNPYEYYEGHHTTDSIIGENAFRDLVLWSAKLPTSVKRIESHAFQECKQLKEVVLPDQLKYIGYEAFKTCTSLSHVLFPSKLNEIGDDAFWDCFGLRTVDFPPRLNRIGRRAFHYSGLESIDLPIYLEIIGEHAFSGCDNLKEIRIPESLKHVEDNAFNSPNIRKVKTWTIQPTNISQNTFSQNTYNRAMLCVPESSEHYYYWDTKWSQFQNKDTFYEPYTYFYIQDNTDYAVGGDTPVIEGVPDADLGQGSGLIIEGVEDQYLGNLTLDSNGTDSFGSIIAAEDASIEVEELNIEINIEGGRWYFFSFPFDIARRDIHFDGQYVWRTYDGSYRAEHGSGAWKNVTGDLAANQGYIFQASRQGKLCIKIHGTRFDNSDRVIALQTYPCNNKADANWNLVGNPHMSYFELSDIDFSSPVTIWDGSNYMAYSPEDDEFSLHPFQAFFVQKPAEDREMGFGADGRETKCQSENPDHRRDVAERRRARARSAASDRLIVNVVVSDGNASDRTRVVFNDASTEGYDMDRDAAKFLSSGVPQIYTIGADNTRYAINERPQGDGSVRLGFYAPAAGTYTLSSSREDCAMEIVDLKTGLTAMLSAGYTFTAAAGTDDDRFVLRRVAQAAAVDALDTDNSDNATYYGVDGINYGSDSRTGVMIKVDGGRAKKVLNK